MLSNKGFTLIELLVVLGMILLLYSIVIPNKNMISEDILLYQTTVNLEDTLKLARHLSIDESSSYRVDIKNNLVTVRKHLYNTLPIYTMEIPTGINVRVTTNQVIYFNRNGASSYHRIVVENSNKEQYILETMIGTGRIQRSR